MTCSTLSPIVANRGSDIEFTFNWKNSDDTNADLSGWAIAAMDVSAGIVSLLTPTITTAATGLITVRIEWDDSLVVKKRYQFRLQITSGINSESTNLIRVVYQ